MVTPQNPRELLLEIVKKTKKSYFSKTNRKLVWDNKPIWRKIKLCFSDKSNFSNKIMISEKGLHSF